MHIPSGKGVIEETAGWQVASTTGMSLSAGAGSTIYGTGVQLKATTEYTWEYMVVHILNGARNDLAFGGRNMVRIYYELGGNEHIVADDLCHYNDQAALGSETEWHLPLHVPKGARVMGKAKAQGGGSDYLVDVFVTGYTRGPTGAPGYSQMWNLTPYIGSVAGQTSDPGTSANTKSGWSALEASTARACKAIQIAFGGNLDVARANDTHWLLDVGVGPAGSESKFVENWPFYSSAATYETPINCISPVFVKYIPAGSNISANIQSTNITAGDRYADGFIYGYR